MKLYKIILISITIIITVLTVVGYPVSFMFWGMVLAPDAPKPKVKSAEFSFRLEYKINGETRVIEDVFVTQYIHNKRGVARTWSGHIKDSEEKNVLLLERDSEKLYYMIHFPAYYMGDEKKYSPYNYPEFAPFFKVYKNDYSKVYKSDYNTVFLDELLEDYGIELISWEIDPPIVNAFGWWQTYKFTAIPEE